MYNSFAEVYTVTTTVQKEHTLETFSNIANHFRDKCKPSNAKIMDDPMGLYTVDLGIVDVHIHGLIETFNELRHTTKSFIFEKVQIWRTNDYPFLQSLLIRFS